MMAIHRFIVSPKGETPSVEVDPLVETIIQSFKVVPFLAGVTCGGGGLSPRFPPIFSPPPSYSIDC